MRRTATLPLILCILAGCESTQSPTLDDALRAYDQKRYAESLRIAKGVQASSTDQAQRQQAAYVAGRSASELNRRDEARDAFAVAARSTDPLVSGRALAMEGAIAVEDKRWSDAAGAYAAAAAKLTGPEGDLARTQARDAAAKATEQANRRAAQVARPPVPAPGGTVVAQTPPKPDDDGDPDPPKRDSLLPPPPADTPWTIAAGAFGTETAARQRATNLAKEAKRAGLPTPRVLAVTAPGKKVWIVEVGSFDDKAKAEAARKKITVSDAAVAHSRAPRK